ncbi:zinc-ribbon domain containing protein [Comamonas piscis]|uniref:Zinc-ribbon domain containing protein n=1 Tax=Comamonas piscis TaxID=1562974 RepID=A0A7G5EFX1_9BURK|nr:zinc-ribbon domain containing protein [Comamonas piscis]QMV72896.1 zinc-ribbon domain containing protein [Comamonas piscis]WSO35674.1 zinc-ribbon domain containing protein [Comamonas piscis]
MKSNKQRKTEIKQRRWARMERQREVALLPAMPHGALAADTQLLALIHGQSFCHVGYYVDISYHCCDCGATCVWTAQDQKWWCEQVQGNLYAGASRCKDCRARHRAWRQSHCDAAEMAALRALWRARPDASARARVNTALQAKAPDLRCLAAQALAWWWVQFGDQPAHAQLEALSLERSWAPRIDRILRRELELRPGVHRVCRVVSYPRATMGAALPGH